jgi:hypothetical protein
MPQARFPAEFDFQHAVTPTITRRCSRLVELTPLITTDADRARPYAVLT